MIKDICRDIGLEQSDTRLLCDTFNLICRDAELFSDFFKVCDALLSGEHVRVKTQALSEKCGIHHYTLFELVLIASIPALRHSYNILKMPELFSGVLDDIRAKTVECKNVYGIVGNICYDWYIGFFNCKRLCLGRLQFERYAARHAFDRWDEGECVINCHIPSIGPLYTDDCMQSFKMAYERFADVRRDGVLPVVCSSWLLHPPTAKCFKEGSNLQKFYELFTVIHSEDDEQNKNFWRVFNCEYKDIGRAPLDTSLQRNIMDMLRSGQNMGSGYGVILFDGKKIIKGM